MSNICFNGFSASVEPEMNIFYNQNVKLFVFYDKKSNYHPFLIPDLLDFILSAHEERFGVYSCEDERMNESQR